MGQRTAERWKSSLSCSSVAELLTLTCKSTCTRRSALVAVVLVGASQERASTHRLEVRGNAGHSAEASRVDDARDIKCELLHFDAHVASHRPAGHGLAAGQGTDGIQQRARALVVASKLGRLVNEESADSRRQTTTEVGTYSVSGVKLARQSYVLVAGGSNDRRLSGASLGRDGELGTRRRRCAGVRRGSSAGSASEHRRARRDGGEGERAMSEIQDRRTNGSHVVILKEESKTRGFSRG